jgi:hypothetical protein
MSEVEVGLEVGVEGRRSKVEVEVEAGVEVDTALPLARRPTKG